MGLNAYTDSGKKGKNPTKKESALSEKEYKSYYLSKSTIDLVNRVTLTKKIEESKYSHDDAIREAFELFAKENGISS